MDAFLADFDLSSPKLSTACATIRRPVVWGRRRWRTEQLRVDPHQAAGVRDGLDIATALRLYHSRRPQRAGISTHLSSADAASS